MPYTDLETKRNYDRAYRLNNPEKFRGYDRARYLRRRRYTVENSRRTRYLREYGITVEEYEQMLLAQGGVCAICRGPEPSVNRRLAVDHDHKTGKVRGLLCSVCNVFLGRLENLAFLKLAVEYVARSKNAR